MPKRKHGGGYQAPAVQRSTPTLSTAAPGGRRVLFDFNTLERLLDALKKCKRIVVVTGAGISVSCGIPDFRSENGVYELASQLDLGLTCPEDLFDLEFFTDDPEPFFKFAKALYPGSYVPSPTHHFLKLLEEKGKLLRNFTQNIDGLEAQVGLKKYVACHGSFLTASCLSCKKKRTAEDIRDEVMAQKVPRCPHCPGVMKPDITFFGEKLPSSVKRAVEADHYKADLLLVFGTSLQVAPVSRILQFMPPSVPQILINRELVRPPRAVSDGFDLHLLGDCDAVVHYLCARLGWDLPGRPHEVIATAAPTAHGAAGDARAGSNGPCSARDGVAPTFVAPNTYVFSTGKGNDIDGEATIAPGPECTGEGSHEGEDFEEVVTCDACNKVIDQEVHACNSCFGYDLCGPCYAHGRNDHAKQTGHTFHTTPPRS